MTPDALSLKPSSQPVPKPQQQARKILFVDDEQQACKWFARTYGNEFDIVTAGSADEAMTLLRERSPEFAVLITDYRMPVRDGLALLLDAQQAHRQVVRLLASAYADKDVAVAAINQGRVMQILEKPFDELQIRASLREALAQFEQREQDQTLLENRAADMRETLGFLAHELNTPLATVLGYMDALKSRYLAPGPDALPGIASMSEKRPGDTLGMIDAAGRRTLYALSLVATFVQSARDAYPAVRSGADSDAARSALPASQLLRTLTSEYPFEGRERDWVSLDLHTDFDLPGQRDLLYLVLCTLTKNALAALQGTAQPRLRITLERSADTPGAIIRFADNGQGIAPEILARLTHEPVTTRAAQGGSGMGLVFCRRVVQAMNGQIDISSEPGNGATVTLQFKPDEST